MEQIYEDEKRKFIKEFNSNFSKTKEVGRLINVLKIIKKNKEERGMKSKLTKEQVAEIISRKDIKPAVLAKEYGVTTQTIYYHFERAGIEYKRTRPARKKSKTVRVKNRDENIQPKKLIEPQIMKLSAVSGQKIKITIEIY